MLVDRRTALRGALAAALLPVAAGCTDQPSRPPAPDPGAPLREAAADRERALLRAYDDALATALAADPAAAGLLAVLRADHAAHLAALLHEPVATTPAAAPASDAPAPGGSATRSSAATAAPSTSAAPAVLRHLAALERETAGLHAAACLEAPVLLAPLMADLAACEAAHAVLLTA